MNLFFNQNIDHKTVIFTFSVDESKHIYKVLRKKKGDEILVTNGKGLKWLGELTEVKSKTVSVKKISAKIYENKSYNLEIAISPPKSNNRIEWFIEKAIEIGIQKIHFIKTENSERKAINFKRLYKLAVSAMKQSKQLYLPEINNIIEYEDFLKETKCEQKFIAHCESSSKEHIANIPLDLKPVIVLIGPEGDFTKKEIDLAITANYLPISLGENRLRSETAAISVTQTFSILFHLRKKIL